MKSLHLLISGRVQGVGFRDWLVREAAQLGLTGWVRNRGDDQVEAIISGPDASVDHCAGRCWHGPTSARVSHIEISATAPPDGLDFTRRGSVGADR